MAHTINRMPRRPSPPPWISLVFVFCGGYIVLISLGVLPYTPRLKTRAVFSSPEHWQITSIGVAFVSAGVALAFANKHRWLSVLNGATLFAAFLAPMCWFVFLSGAVTFPMKVLFGIPLSIGSVGAIYGIFNTARGKSNGAPLLPDPMQAADVYLAHGRSAQAKQILEDAIKRHPTQAEELRKRLNAIP